MPDYTRWPGLTDVVNRLDSAGIALRDPAVIQPFLDAVAAEIGQRTVRQFVADGADTTRVFDGTGTAEMEVDEMVSFSSVTVIGIQAAPGYTLSNVSLVSEQGRPQTRLVVARGSLPGYITEGVILAVPTIFPAGRQNITVTGRFGYAASIPADLWLAACGEAALRAAQEALFGSQGLVIERMEGDTRKKFAPGGAEALGWHQTFEARVKDYVRPSGRRLRNLRPRMI